MAASTTLLAFVLALHSWGHFVLERVIGSNRIVSFQTHLFYMTIYGDVWSSSVKHYCKMTFIHFNRIFPKLSQNAPTGSATAVNFLFRLVKADKRNSMVTVPLQVKEK